MVNKRKLSMQQKRKLLRKKKANVICFNTIILLTMPIQKFDLIFSSLIFESFFWKYCIIISSWKSLNSYKSLKHVNFTTQTFSHTAIQQRNCWIWALFYVNKSKYKKIKKFLDQKDHHWTLEWTQKERNRKEKWLGCEVVNSKI